MPDGAPNPNAPAAPAAAAPTAIPALSEALLERCLKTKRPVNRQVETMLPDFLRQSSNTMQEGLRQHSGETYPDEELCELLTRLCRLIRRAARLRGADAAVDEMRKYSYENMVIITCCMDRDQGLDMAMFEDSENEDQFELMYAMSGMANAGGGNLGGGNLGGGNMGGGNMGGGNVGGGNVGGAIRGGMGGRGGFGGMW